VRFATVGLEHVHIDILVRALLEAGGALAAVVERDDTCYRRYAGAWPAAPRSSFDAVLDDRSIELVVTAAVPSERADIAVRALENGKDVLADKPLCVTATDLERVVAAQTEHGGHVVVWFGERLYNRAMLHAVDLVRSGAIGDVLHFAGFGPHLLARHQRPAWHFDPARNGGILVDLACHQIDAFLTLTGTARATVTSGRAANLGHPDLQGFEDVGDLLLEAEEGALGYARVDWHTPDGLGTWGDGRTFLVGTGGTLELRRTVDPAGRGVGGHLFLVDDEGPQYVPVPGGDLPFGRQVLADVRGGTETSMTSDHALVVTELALRAQDLANAAKRRGETILV
jgi:predicted dehydrogenase